MVLTPISVSETSNSLESYRDTSTKLLGKSKLSDARNTMPDNKINLDLMEIGNIKNVINSRAKESTKF